MRVVAFLLLVCYSTIVSAEEWNRGYVVLTNNRVIKGEFAVRTDCDVVILRNGDALMVYPAHKVKWLSIFDTQINEKRDFISLEETFGAAVTHELYEVLLDGELSVLRKERSSWQALYMEMDDFEYYVQYQDELIPLNKFRRKHYRKLYRSASADFRKHVKEKRLNIYQLRDTLLIIDRINQEGIFTALAQR